MPKMQKKRKEIVNDGISLKFCISNISNFFSKQIRSFADIFQKISDPYKKTIQKFYNFLKTKDR